MIKEYSAHCRIILLLSFCLIVENLFSQEYYISKEGDTVYCEIKKERPYSITVKAKKRSIMTASEIKAYRNLAGEVLTARKCINDKDGPYVLLPDGGIDKVYDYSDGHVNITSDGVTTLYEVVTYGSPTAYGRPTIIDLYIENKSGFSKLGYAGAFAGKKKREEIINTLKQYLGTNESIARKLSDGENIELGLKAVEKLFEEYFNKKLVN